MSFVKVTANFGAVRAAEGVYEETSTGLWTQVAPTNGYTLDWDDLDTWELKLDASVISIDDGSGDNSSPTTSDWTGYTIEAISSPGSITESAASPSSPGQLPTFGGGSQVVTSPGSIAPQDAGSPSAPGAINPQAPGPVVNPEGYLWTTPQNLTSQQKAQLKQNLPEIFEKDFVRPAKFSVVGDSMSVGTTGQWSTLIQSHPLFADTVFNIVAASGAKTFEQDGAYWDANVLPAAPIGDEVAYMSSLIGINDIFQVGGSAGTVRDIYERIKGIWKKGRDAGFKVIAFTLQDHSFGAAGIVEPEQRKSELNQMILSDSSLYDYLVPLHQLIPDENTYAFSPGGDPPDLLHLNAAGNQLIADTIVSLVGPQERGGNGEVKDLSLAAIEENILRLAIQSKDQFYSPYNLALSTDFTASGGTVSNYLGFRRLNTTTTSGSQAAMQFEWPLLDSGNTIAWATERYRGLFVDVDPVTLTTEQVLSVFFGTNNQIKDTHYAGFELRRSGSNFETRIIELRSGGAASESAWVNIGNVNNLKFVFFHKGDDMSLFYRPSNGAYLPTVWQEVNHTGGGGPNSFASSSGRVVVSLDSLGNPSASSGVVTIREIVPFEGDKLPLRRIKY